MKKKIIIFTILLATTFFWLPSDGNTVSAQQGQNRGNKKWKPTKANDVIWQTGKHKGWKHKKNSHGYRNYGQYRKTQVGNRRYRLVRRYYMNDGNRLSRLVRVYY